MKMPFWKQTSSASCGPSCLLMVINRYNPSYRLTRENEWDLWRDSTLLTWKGSHPYGLAVAALKRGLKAELLREKSAFWKDADVPSNSEPMSFEISRQGKAAKNLGLSETVMKDIGLDILQERLKEGKSLIVLIKSIQKNSRIGFLHWVVLTAVEKDFVLINDSLYEEGASRRIPMRLFLKAWERARDSRLCSSKEVLVLWK
jgi:hypothetical protein